MDKIMEAKYVEAIKAGIIGGVIIGFLVIVNLLIAVVASWSVALGGIGLLNCCIFIFIVVAMAGVGALGVRMASAAIRKLTDALVVSAVSGLVAGLIGAVVYIISQIVSPWLTKSSYAYSSLYDTYGLSTAGLSALGALGSICCCGPVILIVAVILAMIGGAIYAALVLKVS
jgi:hypothetical protein